ncbi:Pentatricopeptide repeat [Parasponia andersonii]|uniref:Pentatricopeptide repeat n=1 Tax=Parasponia andersonii TaxID=3476 RepID=A0A2P5E3D5_PARAD|nr:Pentatricopeptide repeat [Parasponia andersonii]
MSVYVQNGEEEKSCEVFLQSRKVGIELTYLMVLTVLGFRERVFKKMARRISITWNAMIRRYTHQGHPDMALALFEEMSSSNGKNTPNYVTLVCVLSACSRAGAVQKGMDIFKSMRARFGLEPRPEHYACIVDLLDVPG